MNVQNTSSNFKSSNGIQFENCTDALNDEVYGSYLRKECFPTCYTKLEIKSDSAKNLQYCDNYAN